MVWLCGHHGIIETEDEAVRLRKKTTAFRSRFASAEEETEFAMQNPSTRGP
jgi:hypothetical protein